MDRTGELTAFARTVESGGFSAAARQLGLTPSAVSKVITRLETRLGVRLLNRTTRALSLTAEGERYFQRAQRILAEIEDAEREITQARGAPRGLLRLNSGVAFGLYQLPPVLPEFIARYPEVELSLAITDRAIDLIEEGVDIAVRIGKLADSSLIARKVCDLERVICASPDYLKRRGTPRTPDDLTQHNCLILSEQPALSLWPFDTAKGLRVVEVHGRYAANNADTVLQMALRGMGIVRMADIVVGEHLASGALVPVLTNTHHVEPVPLHLVFPPGKHRLPKVTAMADFVIEKFAHAPWRSNTKSKRKAK